MTLPLVTLIDRLPRLGIAVAGLRVGQRAHLVEAVEVAAGQTGRLAFVEVAAPPDVSVGQREQRLGLSQDVQFEFGRAQTPWLDRESRVVDHGGGRRRVESAADACSRRRRRYGVSSAATSCSSGSQGG